MAISEVKICNLALNLIGNSSIISITDNNESARACNAFYDPTRREVLRAYPWNFAKKEISLGQTTITPLLTWTYAYQLPVDYLFMVVIENNIAYEIMGNQLYCNEDSLIVKYIADTTDTNLFDSNFINAFAAKLATKIAYKLSDSNTLQQTAYSLYQDALKEARSIDSQEETPTDVWRDFLTEARMGGSPYEGYSTRKGLGYT